MRCNTCGLEENIPFRCNYCRQSFCHLHRIPINHSCPSIDKYAEKRRRILDGTHKGSVPVSSFSNNIRRAIRIKSSKTELLHLFVATLLVTAVGLSFNHYRHISWQFLTILISAFLVHELAHKLLAQYYGSWAEFHAQLYGLVITAISALPIMPWKFIAGAVMVGLADRNKFGRVALVGPLTNLVMGFSYIHIIHTCMQEHHLMHGY